MRSAKAPWLKGLYAIADVDALARREIEVVPFARAVLSAKPAALQLRAKRASRVHTLKLLRELRELCIESDCFLFANDDPSLAFEAGCDGVHVGQHDASVSAVRESAVRALPPDSETDSARRSLLVGVSTHSEVELRYALEQRPHYVAYGPVFPTTSKANPDPVVGIGGLQAARHLVDEFNDFSLNSGRDEGGVLPLVAIGGISFERAREVLTYADAIAVISALVPPSNVRDPLGYAAEQAAAWSSLATQP